MSMNCEWGRYILVVAGQGKFNRDTTELATWQRLASPNSTSGLAIRIDVFVCLQLAEWWNSCLHHVEEVIALSGSTNHKWHSWSVPRQNTLYCSGNVKISSRVYTLIPLLYNAINTLKRIEQSLTAGACMYEKSSLKTRTLNSSEGCVLNRKPLSPIYYSAFSAW